MNMGHWECDFEIDPSKEFGFVYQITNLTNNKKYIGKKQYWQYRNKKKYKPFDWQSYTGSSTYLNEDIETLGKENFKFQILYTCKSLGVLSYLEANEQHVQKVLEATLEDGSRAYYNQRIAAIKYIPNKGYLDEARYGKNSQHKGNQTTS